VEGDRVPELGVSVDGLARRVAAAEAGFVGGGVGVALSRFAMLDRATTPSADDISAQAVPTITSVTPANANAGIGETVTITGTGFGATQGTGAVDFNHGQYLADTVTVPAGVVSWSDTSVTAIVPRYAERWVRVTNGSGQASSTFAYDCGFSADGRHWETLPVTYRINENTGDMTGEGAQIQTAFGIWDAAGSTFDLNYGGSTSLTSIPGSYDGENSILWVSGLGSGVLGRNYYWMWVTSPPEVFESDIAFNEDFTWAATASSTAWDVQTVALHELGHTVGLDDQYQELGDIMGAGVQGQNKRTLTDDEINGAVYLYGAVSVAPSAPAVASSTHPDPEVWSNATSATFSFSSSGAVGYSYVFDGSPATVPDTVSEGSPTSRTETSLPQGVRYFHVRAVGASGLWSATSHYRINVDTVAPTGTAQIGPVGTPYVTSATVVISTTLSDATSGLSQMRTTTNGGSTWTSWVSYEAGTSATLTAEGNFPVGIQVRDRAGNVFSSLRTLTYDVTAPVTTSNAASVYEQSASITLSPTDAVSGVDVTYYGLDASPTVEYTGPVTTSALGQHTLYWYSVDNAGNAEGVKSAAFSVSTDVPGQVTRLAGPNRWDTAIAIAASTFPGWAGVTDIVVACGEDRAMADPLSAAGLAGAYEAPILLVPSVMSKGALPASIEGTIVAIRNANGGRVNIHVIGGTAVVPTAVYSRLDALNGPGTMRRVAGADRYTTSVQVANAIVGAVGIGNVPGVLVANGMDTRAFPDALAAAPASAATHRPLLLVRTTGVPADVYTSLTTTFAGKPRLVVNSQTWVTEAVRTIVGASARIATSADRVAAAVQIAQYACGAGWLDEERICVANTLPDSLSGGGAMGYLRAPIVYTNATALPSATQSFIAASGEQVDTVYALGGTAVISEGVLSTLRTLVD
jgi:hypothetical protein